MADSRFECGRCHIDGGFRVVLVKISRVWAEFVFIADGNNLKTRKVPAAETRYLQPLREYDTPAALAKRFRRGRLVGRMSKRARALLREARAA